MKKIIFIFIFPVSVVFFLNWQIKKEFVLFPSEVPLSSSPTSQENFDLSSVSGIFVGDIMLSRAVGRQMVLNNDFEFPFALVKDSFQLVDFAFGNLEGPISDQGNNQGSQYSFRADPRVLNGLVGSNFKVLNLANNHIWDWGMPALLQTMDLLKENSILFVGVGKNYQEANQPKIFEKNGLRIGFWGLTDLYPASLEAKFDRPGISEPDFIKVASSIAYFKSEKLIDFAVVSPHWGIEYESEPTLSQRQTARFLIERGADLVIGHHPHVIQSYEEYLGRSIFYSLGNFIFDQSFSKETMTGLVVKASFYPGSTLKVTTSSVLINERFQPEIRE